MQPLTFDDLFQSILSAFPGIILAVIFLLVGYLLGRFLYSLTYRLLRRLKFDDAASRAGVLEGLEQAGFEQVPSRIMARLILWATTLSFALLALEALGLDAVLLPLQAVISYLPRIIAASVALIAGLLLAQIAGRTTQATLISFGIEIHEAGGRIVRALVMIITVLVAFDQLNLEIGVLNDTFVGLILVGVGGIALAFALGAQAIVRNILAGYYARDNLEAGDRIVINGREGILEAIGPVYSEMSQGDDVILIPNQLLQEMEILRKASSRQASE
jgi:small-conductance mechanosensitive channel